MADHTLLAVLVALFAAPTPKLPTKKLPGSIMQKVGPMKVSPQFLSGAKLLDTAKAQGVTPTQTSPDTLGVLSAAAPKSSSGWINAVCVRDVVAGGGDAYVFGREMNRWCREQGRTPGLTVHVPVTQGKAYAVECSGSSSSWTITRQVGTKQTLQMTGTNPMFAFVASATGTERFHFDQVEDKFTTQQEVSRCRVSAL